MPHDTHRQSARQFEDIMTTIFTCRGLVKYNLSLSEEQRQDLLTDIDYALDVLRAHSGQNPLSENEDVSESVLNDEPPVPSSSSLPPLSPSPLPSSVLDADDDSRHREMLLSLYRMYYTYLDEAQSTNITVFVERFNDAMTVISDLERLLVDNHMISDESMHSPSLSPFYQVRSFVSDIYYIFMEFFRSLSNVLQENNAHIDTDKLVVSSLDRKDPVGSTDTNPSLDGANLSSLFQVYHFHARLNRSRDQFTLRVTEGTTFLEFLKERISKKTEQREEIVAQLNALIRLLMEMSRLLSRYERAASILFH